MTKYFKKIQHDRKSGLLFSIAVGVTLGLTISILSSCASITKAPPKLAGPRISIMSYNVENLFDTKHDEGTEDYTFLPLELKKDSEIAKGCEANSSAYRRRECFETDWNDKTLDKKLHRLASVVQQINRGKGPDILIMPEVENQNVLDLFNTKFLEESKYVTAKVIDSFDPRGIDPAILSRFPLRGEPKIHRIPLKAETKAGEYSATRTRGILEVPLTLSDGTKAVVYAVHLPSQANPTYLRKQAVEFINQLQADLPPDVLAITGGDFNIVRTEDAEHGYFAKILNQDWQVSHIEGCKTCEGTHYYHPKTEWSFLDAILIRRASIMATGWRLDPDSVRVPAESRFQVNRYGTVARFNGKSAYGVSDHWPIYAEIVKTTTPTASLEKQPSEK